MNASGKDLSQINHNDKGWLRPGDGALVGIMLSDFFASMAGTMVYLTMVWWVLAQGASELGVTLLILSIFIPLNAGVIFSGVAVAKFGARRLLLVSKAFALVGAVLCYALLVADLMTLWSLALLAAFVYGSMGPSVTADVSRAPALVRLAGRRLASFNAANGIIVVLGSVAGLSLGGRLSDGAESAVAIAISAILVAASFCATLISFPRDRILPIDHGTDVQHMVELSRSVIHRLDGKLISLSSVFITVAFITVAEGMAEVLLPIALRASEQPSTALSDALVYTVFASVVAYLAAETIYGKVTLDSTLAMTGCLLSVILIGAAYFGGWGGLVVGAVAATAAASTTSMLLFTSLQLQMPASLQAQAAGLWNSLVLTLSALVIFLTGVAKEHGFPFLILIAIVASLFAIIRLRR